MTNSVNLAVHDELALTGLGFQRDSELITRVLEEQWPISAVFESGENNPLVREKCKSNTPTIWLITTRIY